MQETRPKFNHDFKNSTPKTHLFLTLTSSPELQHLWHSGGSSYALERDNYSLLSYSKVPACILNFCRDVPPAISTGTRHIITSCMKYIMAFECASFVVRNHLFFFFFYSAFNLDIAGCISPTNLANSF